MKIKNLFKFPRQNYIDALTPLEFLPRLSKKLGGPNIFVKRDDLLPLTGGNKVRKLEYVMAEAKGNGCDTLITGATIHSNHCRLTLAAAAVEQLPVHLILSEKSPGSYNANSGGNNLLFKLFGAKSITVVQDEEGELLAMKELANQLREKGHVPFIIKGSEGDAIGALGYVSLAQEILAQCQQKSIRLDHVIVPSGSGSTHAGLLVGLRAQACAARVSGVCVRRKVQEQKPRIQKLVREILEILELKTDISGQDIVLYDEYFGKMHGDVTPDMLQAVKLVAQTEGILLDPIYTGKSMAATIDLIKKRQFTKIENVLFIHTGGQPNLYSYTEAFDGVCDTVISRKL